MKALLFPLFCLFFQPGNHIIGQQNYFTYHTIISGAEEKISKEDFVSAQMLYDSVFRSFDYVFVKDYVIAAQLAAINKNHEQCLAYLEEAMRGGLKVECFKLLYQLSQFLTEADWQNLISKEALFRKIYLSKIDRSLSYEFSRRYREEQNLKGTAHLGASTIRANYFRIISLMDSVPFVSERIIGIDENQLDFNSKKTLASLDNCEAGNSKVIVTLLHSKDPIAHLGMDRFLSAIEQGYLHPRELLAIYTYTPNRIDWSWGNIKLHERPKLHLSVWGDLTNENLETMNRDRQSIGLGKFETDQLNEEVGKKYKLKLRFGYN